jgi:lysophospholipase L1-like esterase
MGIVSPPVSPLVLAQAGRANAILAANLGSSSMARHFVSSLGLATSSVGITAWAEVMATGRIRIPNSYSLGVNGAIISQMISTQLPQLAALNPKPALCFLHFFGNDMAGVGTISDIRTVVANGIALVDAVRSLNITPVVFTCQTQSAYSALQFNGMAMAHQALREALSTRSGVVLVDVTDLLFDPAGATYQTTASLLADGVHFNANGCAIVGKRAVDALTAQGLLPSFNITCRSAADLYGSTDNPLGNLLGNGMLTGTQADTTGSIATGWALSATTGGAVITSSKQTAANGLPSQRFVMSGSYTGATITPVFFRDIGSPGSLVVGDTLEGTGIISVAGAQNIECVSLGVRVTYADTSQYTVTSLFNNTVPGPSDWSGVWRTPRVTLTQAATSVRARISICLLQQAGTNPVAGTIDMQALAIRRVESF